MDCRGQRRRYACIGCHLGSADAALREAAAKAIITPPPELIGDLVEALRLSTESDPAPLWTLLLGADAHPALVVDSVIQRLRADNRASRDFLINAANFATQCC